MGRTGKDNPQRLELCVCVRDGGIKIEVVDGHGINWDWARCLSESVTCTSPNSDTALLCSGPLTSVTLPVSPTSYKPAAPMMLSQSQLVPYTTPLLPPLTEECLCEFVYTLCYMLSNIWQRWVRYVCWGSLPAILFAYHLPAFFQQEVSIVQ